MSLGSNDKLLIAHRRLFEKDEPRYFVRVVEGYDNGVVAVTGFSFVRDMIGGGVIQMDDPPNENLLSCIGDAARLPTTYRDGH